jgi:hypothetical protein
LPILLLNSKWTVAWGDGDKEAVVLFDYHEAVLFYQRVVPAFVF